MNHSFFSNWDIILKLTWANMKSRYRKTIAGFIWVVLNPLLMFGAQSIAFKYILKLEIPDFYLFLLSGLLPWIFITQTMTTSSTIIQYSADLIKSLKISPLVQLYAINLDNFFNFCFAFIIMLAPALFVSDVNTFGLILLPFAILLMLIGVFSISVLLATIQVFLRDVQFIVPFATSVLFFVTPIFFPIDFVPEQYQFFIELNPIYALIDPVRACLYIPYQDRIIYSFAKGFAHVFVLIIISTLYWRRKQRLIYLHV